MIHLRGIIFLLIVSYCASCAIQVPPSGGEQDKLPPAPTKAVPENFSTGFTGHQIAITFDEYIQLRELQSQLIISPPLSAFPEVKVRKKTLYVNFEDTLRENTTYTFNFGNAIADNNEGNPIGNFQYVFSTGSSIDSSQITGKVSGAFDLKPQKDLLVMLYEEERDSVPFLQRPYYFSKTDETGSFKISNIAEGKYKLVALKDLNGDYLYNPPDESIAFPSTSVRSDGGPVALKLFSEKPSFRLLRAYSELPGKAVIAFSGAADTLGFSWLSDTAKLKLYSQTYTERKDTLVIWYENTAADTLQLLFGFPDQKDTVIIRLLKKDSKGSSRIRYKLNVAPKASSGVYQDLNRPFDLIFSHPLREADIGSVIFTEDSLPVSSDKFIFMDSLKTILRYTGKWRPDTRYRLFIPSDRFRDIFGLGNDSVNFEFRTRQELDYATLSVKISSESSRYPAIVQLVSEEDAVMDEMRIDADTVLVFSYLCPGTRRIKYIFDGNNNRRWDTGNYLLQVQPEEVMYYPEKIIMRSNWDVDINWEIQ